MAQRQRRGMQVEAGGAGTAVEPIPQDGEPGVGGVHANLVGAPVAGTASTRCASGTWLTADLPVGAVAGGPPAVPAGAVTMSERTEDRSRSVSVHSRWTAAGPRSPS